MGYTFLVHSIALHFGTVIVRDIWKVFSAIHVSELCMLESCHPGNDFAQIDLWFQFNKEK